jgi:hypothetical protein
VRKTENYKHSRRVTRILITSKSHLERSEEDYLSQGIFLLSMALCFTATDVLLATRHM